MSGALPIEFEASLLEGPPDLAAFTVEPSSDGFSLSGAISTGGRGWSLTATAVRRRRRVSLFVTARALEGTGQPELQDYGYRARVSGLPEGTYEVRVIHRAMQSGRVGQRDYMVRYATALRIR